MKNVLLHLLVLSVFMFSCTKEDLKEPTDTKISFDINRNPSQSGHLKFNSGEIRLAAFKLDADRTLGDDLLVEREFSSGLFIEFDANSQIAELAMDLPQGQYNSIEVEFETFDDLGQNNLVVEGEFTNSMSQSIPVRFEFNSSENFSIVLTENSVGADILLDASFSSKIELKMDPVYWFDIVPTSMLENAMLTNIQGVNTLLITGSVNEPIHDFIVDRIDEAMEISIYP